MARAVSTDPNTLKAALARAAGCATIAELGRLADPDHAGAADPRVAEHVAGCARCQTELALLKQFETAAPRPDEEAAVRWIADRLDADVFRTTAPFRMTAPARAPAPVLRRAEETGRRWRPRFAVRPVAAALALAAAALLVVLDLRGREASPPALSPDAGAGPTVFRSNAVTLLSPADDLDEPPTDLRWEAFPGAVSYSVRVMEVDRTELWKADTARPAVPLPRAVRARIVPGKPLLWEVAAKDARGTVVATSQVQRFRLRLQRPHGAQ